MTNSNIYQGPIVGGGFSESSATWRWAFYINLPLFAGVVPIYVFLFPSHNPDPSRTTLAKLKSIDWAGATLNASTFVLFIVVLSFAGSTWAWKSGGVIALWVSDYIFVTHFLESGMES